MPSTWRKVENENGFPYYVNECTQTKQWDHPKFFEIRQRLDDCNYVKYSSYRTASKMRVLQRALYMEEVPLTVISGVFERHRLGATEGSLCLESYDLEAVLTDIYFAANKQNHTNTDIDYATELTLNLLYNIYDKEREGKVQVSSTKLLLAVLSNCQMSDLYHFIFSLCADHNNCATRLRLQSMLSKLADITTFLHEDVNFGQHLVNCSIEDCFRNSPGLVGINEHTFMAWIESEPQFMSWIPTLFRMKTAETVTHSTRCSVCKTTPIKGLRYRCIKCTRYTQCQHCFLTGRVSHSHKLSHSMKEYCAEGNTNEFSQAIVKKLCSLLRCSVQNNFSIVEDKSASNYGRDWLLTPVSGVDAKIEQTPTSPHSQLQMIIGQLEVQNSQLQQVLQSGKKSEKEMKRYLEEHRLHVAAQIQKLKVLKDYLRVSQPTLVHHKHIPAEQESPPSFSDVLNPVTPVACDFSCRSKTPDAYRTISENTQQNSLSTYSLKDLNSWFGGKPSPTEESRKDVLNQKSQVRIMHSDLDEALAKLQQILANNFVLDESLGTVDNGQLKNAVTEVEGVLTSIIDSVESTRANSVQSLNPPSTRTGSCKYV